MLATGPGSYFKQSSPNTKITRQRGDLARFPKLPWFPEPPVFTEAHPKTPGLSSVPATGSGSLDRPCQENPPQPRHPFLQPKGQPRPRQSIWLCPRSNPFWALAGRTSLTSSQGDPEILIREHGQSPGRSPTSNRQSDHSRPPHGGA